MIIETQDTVRHSPNGSLDTDHYLRRGAEARSAVAWAAIQGVLRLFDRRRVRDDTAGERTGIAVYPAQ